MAEDVYESDEALDDLALECSARLTQMTKTYNDIEAVTKLLEEKEKDLELAAKIGKSLLERNKELQLTNDFLEEQLNVSNEQVTQLKHELQQKIDLLHVFADSECDSGGSTPCGDRFLNWGALQKKLKILEEENGCLKLEASHLKSLTQGLEEKEQQLVNDCVRQLADANSHIEDLSYDLAEKTEEYTVQQREISHLLKELVDKQNSEKRLNYENEEFTAQIQAAQETQLELTQELMDLQERYAEVVALLAETREELKNMKEKLSSLNNRSSSSHQDSMYDSLASEIEASDCSFGSNYSPFSYKAKTSNANNPCLTDLKIATFIQNSASDENPTPVIDNLRFLNANLTVSVDSGNPEHQNCGESYSSNRTNEERSLGFNPKSQIEQIDLSFPNLKHDRSTESITSSYPAPGLGVPGIPGSKDLEFAIKRLSLRRRVELECQNYRRSKLGILGAAYCNNNIFTLDNNYYGTNGSFNNCAIATTTASIELNSPTAATACRSKILLVKPLEGSSTLNQWKDLATPSLGGALHKRSGINVKGGSPPSAGNYSGVHSDSEIITSSSVTMATDTSVSVTMTLSGRHPSVTPGTYTYVTSRILHPSERSIYSSSSSSSTETVADQQRLSDVSDDESPRTSSGNATSTFSTAYGLASALKERCVDLVTASWWLHPYRSSPMTTAGSSASVTMATAKPLSSVTMATAVSKPATVSRLNSSVTMTTGTTPSLVSTGTISDKSAAKFKHPLAEVNSSSKAYDGLSSLLSSASFDHVRSPLDIPQVSQSTPGVITRSALVRQKTKEEEEQVD